MTVVKIKKSVKIWVLEKQLQLASSQFGVLGGSLGSLPFH